MNFLKEAGTPRTNCRRSEILPANLDHQGLRDLDERFCSGSGTAKRGFRSLWCCCNQFDYTLFLLKFLA